MLNIKRRHFLQFAGSTIASLGLSQVSINSQAERYGKVLAKGTSRKIALLVGIDDYPAAYKLRGCLNDVELQRHLLMYRFGFKKDDIHILRNGEATRQGILGAFEEYLINQARPDDVVVFHFSGHGSQIFDPDPIVPESRQNSGLNSTFVPYDSQLPTGYPKEGGTVNDIMGHTLFLLMSAVNSENFTVVLDSCHSGGGTREFRVRARDGGRNLQILPEEKAEQQKWLSKLSKLYPRRQDFINAYRSGVAKGVVLAATQPDQFAADENINGFYGGAFTYRLTQYLWRQTSTPESAINYIVPNIPKDYNQTPLYEAQPLKGYEKQPIYFTNPTNPEASAVVIEVKGDVVTLWLGGVDLGKLDDTTVFTVVGGNGKVIYKSREKLIGSGIVQGNVTEGSLLRLVG